MLNVMVDLETLGTTPNSVFVSIGAVKFDQNTGRVNELDGFYEIIDWTSAAIQRKVDLETVRWWLNQEDAARAEILRPGKKLNAVLTEFSEWLPHDGKIWSNGPTFDVTMLEDAYRQRGWELPWKFWNVRCCRTIDALTDFDKRSIEREGTHHNAFDDAVYQAKWVCQMWKEIRG